MQPFKYVDLLGVPFVNKGRDFKKGLDCWGLAKEAFGRTGIILPDYLIGCLETQLINNEMEAHRDEWRCVTNEKDSYIPCLVVMKLAQVTMINHVGIYIGQEMFLHTERHKGVHIAHTYHPWWVRHIEGYYVPNW